MARSKTEVRKLLVVEDDAGLRKQLKWCFSDYKLYMVSDRKSAITEIQNNQPPVVTLDLGLPPDPTNAAEGLATLEQILSIEPNTKVIVVTGNDEKENALKAIAMGAYDYYQKPVDPEILSLIVERAHNLCSLEQENRKLIEEKSSRALKDFVTADPRMVKMCQTIEKVAPNDVSVLLLGESGTGKELLARALHEHSHRKDNSFIAINCAAIPETLLESELFGYEKGAFTGAQKKTLGKIEYAHEGTLFLDEIGDLSQALQAKLLRFLQERVIERVGGREEIPVDVRIICATHQQLETNMKSGTFREDLFYRISEVTIEIPPLRERVGDAVLLVKYFMEMSTSDKTKPLRLSEEAIMAIEQYDWPGNVRELENKVKRATIMCENSRVNAEDLELNVVDTDELGLNLKSAKDKLEHELLSRALLRGNGKLTRAAELLGVSRPTLYDLLDKHDLKEK
ncbi:MAG: PEP-CTERM-box response regulator transcription factor [Gammaproteobacteria bacterium]|nr:PEP-CTERM-box response regulator transcription factor [Gammaproteobacteria bacterium]